MQHDKSSTKAGHPRDQLLLLLLLAHHIPHMSLQQQQPGASGRSNVSFCGSQFFEVEARTWRATRSFSARSSVSLRSAALWSSITFLSSLSTRQKQQASTAAMHLSVSLPCQSAWQAVERCGPQCPSSARCLQYKIKWTYVQSISPNGNQSVQQQQTRCAVVQHGLPELAVAAQYGQFCNLAMAVIQCSNSRHAALWFSRLLLARQSGSMLRSCAIWQW
jgi:hypothetical protein